MAQSKCRTPLKPWILVDSRLKIHDAYVKRVSQRSVESCVFALGTPNIDRVS